MALLRSEIRVKCGDFSSAQVKQISNSFLHRSQEETCATKSRLSLNLPVEHYSDCEEVDSISGDSPIDDVPSLIKAHCSNFEISPTDSAFHSDDFSPECSYLDGLLSTFSRTGSVQTPSPEVDACATKESAGTLFHKFDSLDELKFYSDVNGNTLFQTGNDKYPWESNWSLTSCASYIQEPKESVPFIIPVPENCMHPRIGSRIVDDLSEWSETQSVSNLDKHLDADPCADRCPSSASKASLEEMSFLINLRDCTVGAGKVARFSCQLMGTRAISVLWTHCNKVVENGGKYRIYRHGIQHSFEIYFTSFSDTGIVSCRAYHRDFEIESRAFLRVRESRLAPRVPSFVVPLDSQETIPGEDVELCCKVRGHPVPVLNWYFNGRKISLLDTGFEIEHIGNEEWLIWIDGKRLLSSSTIKCLAANPLGECISSASVLVVKPNSAPIVQPRLQPDVSAKLENLDKKLSYTKGQVLESAEHLLTNATQMSSLDRQLKVVDAYLDRIEAKFRQPDAPPFPIVQQPPPQLHIVGMTFPPTADQHRLVCQPANPHCQETPAKSKQSVSITVLSKLAESDQVKVVFQKSFESEVEPAEVSKSHDPPKTYSIPLSLTTPEKLKWNVVLSPLAIEETSPYSVDNLNKRLAESEKRLTAALFTSPVPQNLFEEIPIDGCQMNTVKSSERDYLVSNGKEPSTAQVFHPNLEKSRNAEDKVSRAADRLYHLDNRIAILQSELAETDCTPEDLQRLESAVLYTAAEIKANDETIKQVDSLVLHLYQESLRTSPCCKSAGSSYYNPPEAPTVSITYSNMTTTPQDFPQDSPSVKALMSRFQNERPKLDNDNGNHYRRMNSAASEDGSDGSLTSSPDKDRKPLPVFNKTKFQEGVVAARSLPKPKIHASLTARSLSREMREQLRIARPQMGAFRSNIMTAENGEYDPEKALKAKELFMAESVEGRRQENGHRNEKLNRFRAEQLEETHEELEELSPKSSVANGNHIVQSDDEDSYDAPANSGFSSDVKNGVHHYEEDSLDEEGDLSNEHEDEDEVKKNGHGRRLSAENDRDQERLLGLVRNGTHEEHLLDEEEGTQEPRRISQEDDGDIPLSQAPDWALMI